MNLLFVAPEWLGAGEVRAPWIALEALALGAMILLLPRSRASRVLPPLVALGGVVVFVLAVADQAARQSLARPLNLYLDIPLASSVASLLAGNLGGVRALALAVGAVLLLLGVGVLVAALLDRVVRPQAPSAGASGARPAGASGTTLLGRHAPRALVGLVLLGAVLLLGREVQGAADPGDPADPSGESRWTQRLQAAQGTAGTPALRLAREQRLIVGRMLRERETFGSEMAAATASYAGLPGLLEGLGGSEVILAFVESYGVSAMEDPRYAPIVGPRLNDMETRLEAAGLHMVTGRLEAPSQGGQSWFGHGTVLSGLWLDNQLRYDLLLASSRETLVDDFRRAGYATAAVMPAITLAWPEGERFGYDRILAHRDMEYGGPPINWVTKPDEYTWCFFQNRVRPMGTPGRPLFTELALISSHAPWVPILPVLGSCDAVGDGSVYEAYMEGSEPPSELWRDTDRVREHFAMSVEYALHAALVFAERDLGADALLIILGDHQPAPLVTGDDVNLSVPVHVISGRPELVEPFLGWGFVPGAWPPPAGSHPDGGGQDLRMDRFRAWFVPTFSPGANLDP